MLEPVDTPLDRDTILRRSGDQVWLITEQPTRIEHWPLSFNLANLDLPALAAELIIAYATRYPLRIDEVLAKLRRAIAVAPFEPRSRTAHDHDLDVYRPGAPEPEEGFHFFSYAPPPPPTEEPAWPTAHPPTTGDQTPSTGT